MSEVEQGIAGFSADKRALIEALLRQEEGSVDAFPLSSAQQRLWFIDQLLPESRALYNVPAAVRLSGPLDEVALAGALTEVVRRHEVLRSTFVAVAGRPVQSVSSRPRWELARIDLSALPAPVREEEARQVALVRARRPFDLARGPLVRAALVRLGAADHLLVLVLHHIVSDGWSTGVLVREIAALYTAIEAGEPSPLPELPLQYADYARWQRQRLSGRRFEKQLAYWRERLAGELPVIEPARDRARPERRTYRGGRTAVDLPAELGRRVESLARGEGATPFVVLLAAFQALLARYTGRTDVVVGSPVANRPRAELAGLVGFFVNTLPLRTDLGGDPSFRELSRRVRTTVLEAFAHQDVPFERLIEELRPERHLEAHPLVQVMLAYQEAPPDPPAMTGLTLAWEEIDVGVAKLDLTLELTAERVGGLRGAFEYDVDLYDAPTVARMAEHFARLTAAAVAEPDRRLAELPLLSEAERWQVIGEWNDPADPAGAAGAREAAGCLPGLLAASAAAHADDVAASFGESRLTYRELSRRAADLAARLRRLGAAPESVVGLLLPPSLDLCVALRGVLETGAAYLPLEVGDPAERTARLLREAGAGVVVTSADLWGSLAGGHAAAPVFLEEPGGDGAAPTIAATVLPDAPAYLLYTSGSTGRPKGVVVPHRALAVHARAVAGLYGLRPEDRVLQLASIAFDVAAEEIFPTWLAGARVVIAPERPVAPAELRPLIERERLSVLNLPASLWREWVAELARERCGLPACLRLVIVGSETVPAESHAIWRAVVGDRVRLLNAYGLTEATVTSMVHPMEEPGAGATVPVGRPLPACRAHVLGRHGEPVPAGVPGELFLGGPGLARGYLESPAETARRFVPDPLDGGPGARLLRTGDLARRLPNGSVELLGRADDQVKVRGFRVEPAEIEAALAFHPGVRVCAVDAWDDPRHGRRLAAWFVPADGAVPSSRELAAWLRERLPAHLVPASFVAVERLPRTAGGKVDRRALPAPAPEAGNGRGAAVLSPVEEMVAAVWQEVLGVAPSGPDDSFFELGGHSLIAAQAMSRLADALGVSLPLRRIFEAPTVAALAAAAEQALRAGAGAAAPLLRPLPRGGELPLSFAQERLWFLDRLQPGSAVYNMPAAFRLRGPLRVAALAAALRAVAERHEVLRTGFPAVDGRPAVVVQPEPELPLPVVDLASLEGVRREAAAAELAVLEAGLPFDLARPPLCRALLLRCGSEDHLLLVSLHHVVFDGWSFALLVRELGALYAAEAASPGLPPLPVQYADYAAWQREWLRGEFLESQLAYWRGRLAGLPVLDLPADRPRPPVQTFRGATLPVRLSPALAAELAAFTRSRGATVFMGLLALVDALLARYSGQEDVVLGTPVANRERPEVRDLIGLFLNMLVLRTDLSGGPGLAELLRRARETALGAYSHQEVPFERLVEALVPERDLGRAPLFQVMLSLQSGAMPELRLPGVAVEPAHAGGGTSRFDLTLAFESGGAGELLGALEYATDLFDATRIERLGQHLELLAAAALAEPLRPLCDLPLLSPAEAHQILEWNDTRHPLDLAAPAMLHGLFERQAERTPGAVALVFEGRSLTYRDLDRWANRLAHRLRRSGLGPESRVGLYTDRSLAMGAALLGILKAGAAYVPLDPSYPRERIAAVLTDAGVAAIVAPPAMGAALPPGIPRIDLTRDGADLAEESPERPPEHALPASPAYVLYTSGSTGRPKGVVVPHANAVHFCAGMDRSIGSGPGVFLAVTSIAFDISVLELFWALGRGFTVVIQRNEIEALYGAPQSAAAVDRPIDLSLFYFADEGGAGDRYRLLIEGAKFADRHGFAAVWTPERHFHSFGGLYPNPAVTGAAIAAVTERIGIRAGSVVLPLHSPLRVAEEWSVVDNISRGRVAVSFASGWHSRDFAIAPQAFRRRRELLLESLDTVRRLWRGESVRVPDGEGREIEVAIHPRPVQPELPVWLTAAGSPETFRVAGEAGANVLTHLLSQTEEELRQKIAVYREARRRAGHPGEGRVTLMLHTFVGSDLETVRETVRQPFRNYLRSSVDLLRGMAAEMGLDARDLRPEDLEPLLDRAFERYFETSGLFGTAATCLRTIDRLRALGVDEIGCLIDFGVDTDQVLASLHLLAEVRERSARPAAERDDSLAAQVLRHGVTHLQCTPSLARMLISDPRTAAALRNVETFLVGGEALPPALAAELARATPARIHNMYGPTETTVWSTTHMVRPGEPVVPIGRPIAGTEVHVLDARFRPVPVGVAGELAIGGAGVARGYLGRPDLTAERFVPDPSPLQPGGRVYRTGDLVRWRADGELEFLGRRDHQVKIRGHRVEPAEIEAVLASHPAVREGVVVAREDAPGDAYLAAYAVMEAAGAGLRLAVDPARQEELLAGRRRFVLPNGLPVAHLGDLHTRAGYIEIFEQDTYLRHGITLEDGDCIFDVGANIGFFTLYAHQRCRPSAVFAFEPIPATFDALRTNVELYGLGVKLFRCGVGDRPGTAEFTFYPGMDGLSGRYADVERDREITRAVILDGLRRRGEAAAFSTAELDAMLERQFRAERHVCEIRTLSDIIREHAVERIDLLKVDVERAECDVLAGIRDEDWERIRQIVLEVDTPENLAAVLRLLADKGYDAVAEDLVTAPAAEGVPAVEVSMVYAARRGQARPPAAAVPEATPAGLRAYLRERLPEAMVPATVTLLDALPLTPNGKVDRRALPPPGDEGRRASSIPYQEPASEPEQRIAAVWRELLGAERIGIHDNFFEVGGNSLLLVRVHSRLQEVFGREIPVLELFRNPTIAALAAHLGGDAAPEHRPAVDARGRAERQALAIQGSSALERQRQFMRRRRQEGQDD